MWEIILGVKVHRMNWQQALTFPHLKWKKKWVFPSASVTCDSRQRIFVFWLPPCSAERRPLHARPPNHYTRLQVRRQQVCIQMHFSTDFLLSLSHRGFVLDPDNVNMSYMCSYQNHIQYESSPKDQKNVKIYKIYISTQTQRSRLCRYCIYLKLIFWVWWKTYMSKRSKASFCVCMYVSFVFLCRSVCALMLQDSLLRTSGILWVSSSRPPEEETQEVLWACSH